MERKRLREKADRTSPLDAASAIAREEIASTPAVAPEELLYPNLRALAGEEDERAQSLSPERPASA